MKSIKDMSAIELIEYIAGCPYMVDKATVPCDGIDAAPEQVVVNVSINWQAIERAHELAFQYRSGNLTQM